MKLMRVASSAISRWELGWSPPMSTTWPYPGFPGSLLSRAPSRDGGAVRAVDHGVEFAVIGGVAARLHGPPRFALMISTSQRPSPTWPDWRRRSRTSTRSTGPDENLLHSAVLGRTTSLGRAKLRERRSAGEVATQ